MGVMLISLLLGGFAQDNLGALMAGENPAYHTVNINGFTVTIDAKTLANPYGGLNALLEPRVGLTKGIFSFSLGYLVPLSPGDVIGVPISIGASASIGIFDKLYVKPRVSVLGPATFFAGDPYTTYATYATAGAGADLEYDPFTGKKLRPVISLGATAAYAFGRLISDIDNYEEPLDGFGIGGNASLALIYKPAWWGVALESGISYGGRFVPHLGLSFIW